MNGQDFAKALHTGRPVFGTLIVSPSPIWLRALEGANLDFVFIDTEHIPLDREKVSFMCHLYKNNNLAPIVRITEPCPTLAAATLDGGAVGIIAPYVESAAQVRELAGAVKFRPLKGQRLQHVLNGETLEPALQAYLDKTNAANVLIVNIESVPAMENLDEILAVPGLDSILIGPHDLSCSLGIPEQYNHPKFEAAVQSIIKKARAAKIGAGMHFWSDMDKEVNWLKSGLNMLIHSGDISLFGKHLKIELQAITDAASGKNRMSVNNHHMSPVSQEVVV